MRIGNRTQAFELYHIQWSWMTHNPDFKVTPLFDAEYLRNSTKYRHSRNYMLIGTYTRTHDLSDREWLSEIFNDTK